MYIHIDIYKKSRATSGKKCTLTQEKSDFTIAMKLRKRKGKRRNRTRSPLNFDNRNKQQIRSEKYFPSARRLFSAALLERWPQVCLVKITFKNYRQFVSFPQQKFRQNAL